MLLNESNTRYYLAITFLLWALLVVPSARTEVTLDGSLNSISGSLAGPDFVIPAQVGVQQGGNLFHSFGAFNVFATESATFTGPNSVQNILGRVTGGSSSTIDGLLRSTIPGADLFLLNPAGILFGPNASLDVQGSFHASSADYIRLGEEGRFSASTNPSLSVLISAPPTAFGFLSETPADITVDRSKLSVPEGETLSVVGGDIRIAGGQNGFLFAPDGRIDVASVASPGEVVPGEADLSAADVTRLGKISLEEGGLISVSGEGAGNIYIKGGQLLMSEAAIRAPTEGDRDGDGGGIDVKVNELEVTDGAFISAITFGDGKGGTVAVAAQRVGLSGGEASTFTGIAAQASSGSIGDAGDVIINAGRLEVRDGAVVSTDTFGSGRGGNAELNADTVLLAGGGSSGFTGITAQAGSGGGGDAGEVRIKADSLEVHDGAQINTSTSGAGRGGDQFLAVKRLELSGVGATNTTGLFARANSDFGVSGDGGDINVVAQELEVRGGAQISTTTNTNARGGNISVVADSLFLSGEGAPDSNGDPSDATGIFARAESGFTKAGDITIQGRRLEMRHGAQISASGFATFSEAGNMTVAVDEILLAGDSAETVTGIFTTSGSEAGGNAGNLTLIAENLEVREGARLSVNTNTVSQGRGGSMSVNAKRILLSGDGASIPTGIFADATPEIFGIVDGTPRAGDAGDIQIVTDTLLVLDRARISATAREAPRATFIPGTAGSIKIRAREVEVNDGGEILAGSTLVSLDLLADPDSGKSGSIIINASESLQLLNGGNISVQTTEANAGSIDLQIGKLVLLRDRGRITTSVASGQGDGGNITIDPVFVVLDGGSAIIATAKAGFGGNIDIRIIAGGDLFQSPDSVISASSELGIDGLVRIDSPDTNIIRGISKLPESFLDISALLSERCAVAITKNLNSFVIVGRGGIPLGPEGSLLGDYGDRPPR